MHHMLAICRRKSSQKTIQKEGGKIVWKIVIQMSQQVKPGGKKKNKKTERGRIMLYVLGAVDRQNSF